MLALAEGIMYRSSPLSGFKQILLISIVLSALLVPSIAQSTWQDVTQFHPYCVRMFRTCVETSHSAKDGVDYSVAVGICGNKMAICTFSNNLSWPWSSGSNQGRPQSISVDATTRLTRYRDIVTIPSRPRFLHWENLTEFLPDCLAEFRRCCGSQMDPIVIPDRILGICGRGMSLCTEAQGRWPYGNDSSAYWLLPYTAGNVQAYRQAYLGILAAAPEIGRA